MNKLLNRKFMMATAIMVSLFFVFQIFACGTLIYPERRGQKAGQIDVGIAILDGLGLLLFIIPGAIAFAVDFTTGAIFLPGGKKSANDPGDVKVTGFDRKRATKESLASIVEFNTGVKVDFDSENMQITRLHSTKDALNLVSLENSRIAQRNFMVLIRRDGSGIKIIPPNSSPELPTPTGKLRELSENKFIRSRYSSIDYRLFPLKQVLIKKQGDCREQSGIGICV